jgi:IS5 family transposase
MPIRAVEPLMPQQISFAQAEYEAKRKTTRRDRFLGEMERVVPWAALLAMLSPYYYPTAGQGRGRPPIGLERMLRMYFLQQWFGLADEALEDAIYDSQAFRTFLGLDLGRESVPDATTLLNFRHLMEEHGLTERIFETVKELLRERGLLLERGTLVDATIIAAPASTKNKDHARDPEMHQAKKGNQWHFAMLRPHRRRRRLRAGPHGGLHRGQRRRRDRDAQPAPRHGARGPRRCRLHRGREARRGPRPACDLVHRHEARQAQGHG